MKVYFVGAGAGSPELITLKGKRLIEEAKVILYAGSLVNPELLKWADGSTDIQDTSGMNLGEVCDVFKLHAGKEGVIVRLHTGDPSLYGAIGEQIEFCNAEKIRWEVVPGVSSFSASAAALGAELTLPGISQTVILTRRAGRTPVPENQTLEKLAETGGTLVLFLTSGMVEEAMKEIGGVLSDDTPAAAVYRASWDDQKILRGTISTIAEMMADAGINRQAIIMVGKVLDPGEIEKSKLYDPSFTHGWRKGK